MKKVLSLFLLLVILVGCNNIPESSSANIPSSSVSVEEKGVNGMTETEITDRLVKLVNNSNALYRWLRFECHQDLDESLEKIYDVDEDSPDGFYWEPVSRFKTKADLYAFAHTIYTEEFTNIVLGWLFGDEPVGPDDNWKPEYIVNFQEIDGHLYVKSDHLWEDNGDFHKLDITTGSVIEEKKDEILCLFSNPKVYFVLAFENAEWVLTNDGNRARPKDWE